MERPLTFLLIKPNGVFCLNPCVVFGLKKTFRLKKLTANGLGFIYKKISNFLLKRFVEVESVVIFAPRERGDVLYIIGNELF